MLLSNIANQILSSDNKGTKHWSSRYGYPRAMTGTHERVE